jgi:hypothetical protein
VILYVKLNDIKGLCLVEEDFTASPQSQTETFPYDISTAYPPHDQEINTKFKMKINNIINEHPPNQHV